MDITIIGKGNGWEDAPLTGQTWGVNDLILRRPVTLLFDMHYPEDEPNYAAVVAAVNAATIPLVTLEPWLDVPTSVAYPLREIVEAFRCSYFSNSVAYMIAYALWQGATRIDLYGVMMALTKEYQREKGSLEYWIGYARGRGVSVTVHGDETAVLKTPDGWLYGYSYRRNQPQPDLPF